MSISNHYEVTMIDNCDNKLEFHFESLGHKKLLKAIEFELLPMWIKGRPVYNLGFGDSQAHEFELTDISVSNNGDVYKVFNTVLSTIPVFFEHHPNAAIHVRGSDGFEAHFAECILECKKACIVRCKKEGRRMAIYRSFINKYYGQLITDYVLLGGTDCKGPPFISWEHYVVGKLYDVILVHQRKTN